LDRLWQQRIETVQGVALALVKLVANAHLVPGMELVPSGRSGMNGEVFKERRDG
jgi:hypothetical protein